jgi:phosphoribosylaminoimidazole-succinocarboxamide synthase
MRVARVNNVFVRFVMLQLPIPTEGKTKILLDVPQGPAFVEIFSKNDLTGGNGARHEIIEGKGELANRTACNVFEYLKAHGIPMAYQRKTGERTFLAERCDMLPLEVVVRAKADGSLCKRYPAKFKKFDALESFMVEFYLKTADKEFTSLSGVTYELPVDDPYIIILGGYESGYGKVNLYHPGKEMALQKPFLSLSIEEVFTDAHRKCLPEIRGTVLRAFGLTREAWAALDCDILDCKFEFGITSSGRFVLGDVVDNDSWRNRRNDKYICKQPFRDGAPIKEVMENYELVAALSDQLKEASALVV